MSLKFKTDGVRGVANTELSADFALLLGRAAATFMKEQGHSQWLIGWDTRLSSEMLASAFASGVASAGAGITSLGEIPTAGVSWSCRNYRLPGAVITASHNPYLDNGIKLFGSDGSKPRGDVEGEIEELVTSGGGHLSGETGRIRWEGPQDADLTYREWLLDRAQKVDASNLNIGLDCANGAGYNTAPQVIEATGARIRAKLGCSPDGRNINRNVGSTHLEALREYVVSQALDFGLALDGDADRILAVDSAGETVDGDEIIAILAQYRSGQEMLPGNGIVVTEWSNRGLLWSMADAGISVEECPVGDKYVSDALNRSGLVLGGEQSGHIIMTDILPVGDGISTAIEFLAAVAAWGRPLREVTRACMATKRPQTTVNIKVTKDPALLVKQLGPEQEKINGEFGEHDRLILRVSGTERVVRVMAEADEAGRVSQIVQRVKSLIEAIETS